MRKITNNRRDRRSQPLRGYRMPVRQKGTPKKAAPWCWGERSYSNTVILRLQRIKKVKSVISKELCGPALLVESLWPQKRWHTNRCVRMPIFRINRNLDGMKCEGWSGTLRHTYCAGTPEPSWLTTSKSAWVSEWARSDLICMRSTPALRTFAAEQRELHYKLKASSLNGIHAFWRSVVRLAFSRTETEDDVAAINFAAHPPPLSTL